MIHITTKELIYKMTFEEEANERFRQLQEDINHGLELRGEDKAFYEEFKPKYGYKARLERKTFNEGSAYPTGHVAEE
ncbi:hypothetical protein [Tepidibacillus marianensis]|uniref:hypothetical protein n=1 Tax=Tepidibacillus marianensis TaxID=3131995 RepID=UPI0030D1A237